MILSINISKSSKSDDYERYLNELIVLKSRLTAIKSSYNKGLINYSDYLNEHAKAADALLYISQNFDFEKFENEEKDTRILYYITLELKMEEINQKEFIDVITQNLISLTHDYSINIKRLLKGSIIIVVEGTEEGWDRLKKFFNENDGFKLAGHNIIKISRELEKEVEKINRSNVILFLASNPSNLARLQLEKEFVRVSSSLQETENEFKLVAEWAVTPNSLQMAILKNKPRIIHFSGHGEKSKNEKEGGLILQDSEASSKVVKGKALANLFKIVSTQFQIDIVVLNSCYSKDQADAIAEHVPYVIGMTDKINDNSAIEFSAGFYRGLASQNDVEFSYELTKNLIELEGLPDEEIPILQKKVMNSIK